MTTADCPATMCEAFQRTASIDPDAVAITLTMKLERKPIMAKYANEIEELYSGELPPEVHEPSEAATVQPA